MWFGGRPRGGSVGSAELPDWNDIIFHICQSTGWTWDYVLNNIGLHRYRAMRAYWEKNPPLHLMVKAFIGIKDKPKPASTPDEVTALFAKLGGNNG